MVLFKPGGKDKAAQAGRDEYYSQQKSGYWFLIGFGVLFILLPSPAYMMVWGAVRGGDYLALMVLLFPAVGAGIAYGGWTMRRNYLFYGPTPLRPDPHPGQAGGEVGGTIRLSRSLPEGAGLNVWLSCIRGRESGSGKDRKTIETILWQNRQKAWCEPVPQGTEIRFCFAVPAEQPSSFGGGRNYICWRVELEGQVAGRRLKRSWQIPVVAGEGVSSIRLPESHLLAERRERQMDALASASEQILVEQTGQGLRIYSAAGRHPVMKLSMAAFGAVFTAVGVFLFMEAAAEGVMLYFMALVFAGLGLPTLLFPLYALGRSLEAYVRAGDIQVRRCWLGIPLYRRQGRLLRADQLRIASNMSTTSNGRKTDYMYLYAQLDGKKLRLAESVAGEAAADALREAVLRALRLS